MAESEEPLFGGNVATGVVRLGATVRKPVTPATPAVEAVLRHLEQVGFTGAPRFLGRDAEGRQVLEYVDGPLAHALPPMGAADLARVGRLVRDLHEALASFEPSDEARWDVAIAPDRDEQVCHHDLAPWNLVLGADRWVFIDWDGAGPGSRMWDLAYTAQSFTPLQAGGDPARDAPRLRALVDGYGADPAQREQLPSVIEAHTRGMFDLLVDGARSGRQPWARLHAEGHARHWGPAADYVAEHLDTFARVLSA
ncbi:Phosphotransferase enzyme family protein [Blastococcus aggregatus]|uniref:Phosphotransferase enzyme family protein n=1 Tax=Blastococcus aggregatus TaxID=38502 RepID=A0A285UZC8_9ACTN|nr:phosphotransferase [Blastococcus aggregatus]SOC46096.1 Phosphotransferase enzyme family protein [Blastococcus aggregatus]